MIILVGVICFFAGMVAMSHIIRSNNNMARKLFEKQKEVNKIACDALKMELGILKSDYECTNDPETKDFLIRRIEFLKLVIQGLC